MKKVLNIFFGMLLAALIVSCEKTTEGLSRITYFPEFTLSGSAESIVAIGSVFTDPGAIAKESGATIPVSVSVTSKINSYNGTTVDTNTPDVYYIKYSAVNSDGFSGNVFRQVTVSNTGDFVNSIEGVYTSTCVRNGASAAPYNDMKYILIWKEGSDFVISDYIGGYYDIGRGYGYGYAAIGPTITINNLATNDVTINGNSFEVGTFGGEATIESISFNTVEKTITFSTKWDQGYTFVVTLKQQV